MKKADYRAEFKLNHDELPAIVNAETGEVKVLTKRSNNIPEGKELHEPTAKFLKYYPNSWAFLKRELNDFELRVCLTLALLAKAHTNSLEPLNDETMVSDLVVSLGISRNKVKSTLQTLWNYGVYGAFEVKEADKPYTKYWIFNPYLIFNGKLIDSGITRLFRGTHVAKAFYDENYRVGKRLLNK